MTGPSATFPSGEFAARNRTQPAAPSDADVARARRLVAARARDADDCAHLLDMLGLLDEKGDET